MRIVSLLPSATEMICGLGLSDQLVGVTHECDFPPGVEQLPKVTRTLIPHDATSRHIDTLVRERLKTEQALYSLDMPVLESLSPDLIVTQALCDVCAVAESEVEAALGSLPGRPQLINLEPTTLDEVFEGLRRIAKATDFEDRADDYLSDLTQRVAHVRDRSQAISERPRVMLLEWIDPPFSAGHWSPELVALAGGREVIGIAGERSRTVAWEEVREADPEVLIIACCGFSVERTLQDAPILQSYPGWDSLSCVRSNRIYIVDGSAYFSRPGPRLVDSLEILAHTFHPSLHRLPDDLPHATLLVTG